MLAFCENPSRVPGEGVKNLTSSPTRAGLGWQGQVAYSPPEPDRMPGGGVKEPHFSSYQGWIGSGANFGEFYRE